MKPIKFQREDILFVVESLQHELNRKPITLEVAERLGVPRMNANYYLKKYGLRDRVDQGLSSGRTVGAKNKYNVIEEQQKLIQMLEQLSVQLKNIDENMKNLMANQLK